MKNKRDGHKKFRRILLALLIGLAAAMVIMAAVIYFGYSAAYQLGTNDYAVKILGLNIFVLSKTGEAYAGTSIGVNMGIFCAICMTLAVAAEEVIAKFRHRKNK